MHLAHALAWASQELQTSSDSARLDAELLLAESLRCSRLQFITDSNRLLKAEEFSHFQSLILRRKLGEPVAYLVGHKEFWSLPLKVTRATLIPRPETELLVELVLQLYPKNHSMLRLADLGTGSGALALALSRERPSWEIYATDESEAALSVAAQNAASLGLTALRFLQGSWCKALPALLFDVMIANPPYLSESEWEAAPLLHFEPSSALVSEEEGLKDLWILIEEARSFLRRGGFLLLEHGFEQGLAVRQRFLELNYQEVATYKDLAGKERVSCGRLP